MIRLTRLMVLSAMTLGLVACGGAKLGGGKEGAAQAAFQASQPIGDKNKTSATALAERALASGAVTLTVEANCAKSGKASWSVDVTDVGQNGMFNLTVKYDACNQDGQNEYNGTMVYAYRYAIDLKLGSFAFITSMKGKLNIDGEISDYIDADVTLSMELTATSVTTGSVKLVLDGTIKTSDGSYIYADETISVIAGELPKA